MLALISYISAKMDSAYQRSLFERLSTPKSYKTQYPGTHKKWRRSPKEAQVIFDRLHSQNIKCKMDFSDDAVQQSPMSPEELEAMSDRLHRNDIKCRMFYYTLPQVRVGPTLERTDEKNEKFYQQVRNRQQLSAYSTRQKTLIDLKPVISKSPRKIHYVF